MNKRNLLSLLLAGIMVFSLTACSSSDQSTDADNTSSSDTAVTKAASSEDNYFRVGMECDYAPFNWTQADASDTTVAIDGGSGYADGYDVQMAKLIADALGKELVIVKTAWDGLPMALTSGKIDAIIAGMSPTEERKATIDFTDIYWASDMCIVVKKDGPYAKAASLVDFSGAKLTGQLNTSHYDVLDQIEGVKKQEAMDSFPQMIIALTSGSIDGYTCETPSALSATAANADLTYIKFADGKGFEVDPVSVSCAVGLQKESDLTEKINEVLTGISEDTRQQMMSDAVDRQPLSEE